MCMPNTWNSLILKEGGYSSICICILDKRQRYNIQEVWQLVHG